MSGVSILPSNLSNMFFTVLSYILGVYIPDVVLLATDAWRTVGRCGYCLPWAVAIPSEPASSPSSRLHLPLTIDLLPSHRRYQMRLRLLDGSSSLLSSFFQTQPAAYTPLATGRGLESSEARPASQPSSSAKAPSLRYSYRSHRPCSRTR